MPIPEQFTYADEADFRRRFLLPLLQQLGYSLVVDYHGAKEFGKDLVLGEYDRFGLPVYHGLQAKFQSYISQSDALGLVEDCKEAFIHAFRHPATGAECRVATFTAVNAGTVSDNARDSFFKALAVPHGGCVRIIDGPSLLQLARWSYVSRGENLHDSVYGVELEILANSSLISEVRDILESSDHLYIPYARFSTAAVVAYLTRPAHNVASDILGKTLAYRLSVERCNASLDAAASIRPTLGVATQPVQQNHIQFFFDESSRALAFGQELQKVIDQQLAAHTPLIPI